MGKNLPVILEQDEDGKYIVTCPVFEGCYSQGNTFEEAMKNIREAIELCLEEKAVTDIPREPPLPSLRSGRGFHEQNRINFGYNNFRGE